MYSVYSCVTVPIMPLDYLLRVAQWDLPLASSLAKESDAAALYSPHLTLTPFTKILLPPGEKKQKKNKFLTITVERNEVDLLHPTS